MSQISALKRITSNNTNVFNNNTINKYQDVSQHHNCNQIILNKDSMQVYIGRDIECNYRISSIEISRKHALIEYSVSDNYWNISDLNSTNGLFVNAVQLQSYSPYRLVNGDKVSFGPPNQSQFCYQFVDNYSSGGQQPLTQPSSQGNGGSGVVGTGSSSGGGVGNGSGISYELSAIGLTTSLPTVIPIVTRIQTSTGSGASVGGLTASGYRHSSSLRLDIDANQSRTISLTANMPTTRSGINYSLSTTTTTTNTSRGTRSPRMSTGGGSGSHTSGSGWRCGTTFRTSGNPYVDHDYSNRGQHSSPAPKAVKAARLARIREAICRSPLTVAPMMARGESSTAAAKMVSDSERKRFDKELAKLERTKRSLEERSAGEMEKIRRRESHLNRKQLALDRKERETARREKELDKMRKELAKEKRRLREQQLQRDSSGDRRRQRVANNGGRDEPCDSSSQQTAVSSTSAKRKLRSDSAAAKRQCNTKHTKAADTETSGNDSDQTVAADSGVSATSTAADTKEPMEEIFESEMTCPVCHEYFVHAVNLNCSHTFCYACIEEWKHSKAGAHVCPICRKRIENQNRELVLDNLIDRFVAKMKPELREHREKLVAERKKRLEKKASEAAAAAESASAAAHGSRGRVRVDVGGLSQLRFFLSGGGAAAESDLDNYNVIGVDFGAHSPFITDAGSSSDSSVSSVSSSSDSSDDDNNSSDDDSDDDNVITVDNIVNNNNDGRNTDRNNNSSDDDSSDDDNSDAEGGVITISAEDFAVQSDSDDNNSSDSDDGGDDSSTFDVDSDSDSSVQSVRSVSTGGRGGGATARASHSLASDQSSHYDSDDGSSVAFESDFSDND